MSNANVSGTNRNSGQPQSITSMEGFTGLSPPNQLSNFSVSFDSIILPHFDGDHCAVSIENWLDRFEELARLKNFSDEQKVLLIGNYLSDESLEWYMSTKKHHDNLTFQKLKSLFLNRFGVKLVDPIVEFTRLKYDQSKGVLDYYKNKRRLGNNAGLTEDHIVSLMIDGLPSYLSSAFIAIRPQSMDHFLQIATRAEDSSKLRENRNLHSFRNRPQSKMQAKSTPMKPKPPAPCRICENLGFKNRFHWSSDCRNRNQLFKRQKIDNANDKTISKSLN